MGVKQKLTDSVLEWLFVNKHSGRVVINSNSLFESLANENDNPVAGEKKVSVKESKFFRLYRNLQNRLLGKHRKGFRFVMLSSTIFFVIVFTLYFAATFINDVILFDTDLHVNEQGALNPRKALNCEYAMYLFNPSEVWANTGVRINKGDEFRINFSGGAATSISDVINASLDNLKPLYGWMSYDSLAITNNDTLNLKYCLSKGARHNEETFDFGSIIYTIQPEGAKVLYDPLSVPVRDMYSWQPGDKSRYFSGDRDFQKANKTGFLYLAVNDIVFGDYEDEKGRVVKGEDNIRKYLDADSLYFLNKAKGYLKGDRISYKNEIRPGLDSILKADPSFFYKDNVGQILLSVEIKRTVPRSFFNPMMAYRDFEYRLSDLPQADINDGWIIKLLISIGKLFVIFWYFLAFFIHITILYAIGMIQLWLVIIMVFFVFNVGQQIFYRKNKTTPETT